MGCFDEVIIRCPKCCEEIEIQSKAGDCSMCRYNVHEAPVEILGGLNGETFECKNCEHVFTAKVITNVVFY